MGGIEFAKNGGRATRKASENSLQRVIQQPASERETREKERVVEATCQRALHWTTALLQDGRAIDSGKRQGGPSCFDDDALGMLSSTPPFGIGHRTTPRLVVVLLWLTILRRSAETGCWRMELWRMGH